MAGITELLRNVSIFRDLDSGELARVAEVCREQNFVSGEYIFREGESGNRLYLIVEGDVRIRWDPLRCRHRRSAVEESSEAIVALMEPGTVPSLLPPLSSLRGRANRQRNDVVWRDPLRLNHGQPAAAL